MVTQAILPEDVFYGLLEKWKKRTRHITIVVTTADADATGFYVFSRLLTKVYETYFIRIYAKVKLSHTLQSEIFLASNLCDYLSPSQTMIAFKPPLVSHPSSCNQPTEQPNQQTYKQKPKWLPSTTI